MRNRLLVATILMGLGALAAAPAGHAQDSPVTTTVNSPVGTRTMTVPASLAVAVNGGSSNTTAMNVTVQEVLAAGSNWQVFTDLCGTTDGGVSADCSRVQLDRSDLASSIGGALNSVDETDGALGVVADTVNSILNPCPSSSSGEGTLASQQTIMSCSGTTGTTAYSGLYSWVGTYGVDLTSFFESGTYQGYVRFTLQQ